MDYYGETLLHSAIMRTDLRRVQALIKLGARTSGTTTLTGSISNATALNHAICNKDPKILACLLKSSDSSVSMNILCNIWIDLYSN